MKCIVGLGNPSLKFKNTRHNLGFAVIAKLAEKLEVSVQRARFKGLYAKTSFQGESIVLLQPLTFMNNSGYSVAEMVSFFKCDLQDILIVYDDLDFAVGKLRFRMKGSSGGHNGMKSIINQLGCSEFPRLRLGIGKPEFKRVDYVLSRFSEEEQIIIDKVIDTAAEGALCFAVEGIDQAMNKYNIDLD